MGLVFYALWWAVERLDLNWVRLLPVNFASNLPGNIHNATAYRYEECVFIVAYRYHQILAKSHEASLAFVIPYITLQAMLYSVRASSLNWT